MVQVSMSRGGIPKRAIPSAELTACRRRRRRVALSVPRRPTKAILLVTSEGIDELVAQGFPLFPGALGENLTTRGLDRRDAAPRATLSCRAAAIELTLIRTPCATLDVYGSGIQAAIYDARVQAGDPASPRWGLSGFYASVIQPGIVNPGDTIALLE